MSLLLDSAVWHRLTRILLSMCLQLEKAFKAETFLQSLSEIRDPLERFSGWEDNMLGTNPFFSHFWLWFREWIGPASVMYMVEQLLEEYTKGDTVTRSLVTNLQFIIVPIANPDGYVYSWATDRLWRRKNRRANAGGSYGVDLNRNWDANWGGKLECYGFLFKWRYNDIKVLVARTILLRILTLEQPHFLSPKARH